MGCRQRDELRRSVEASGLACLWRVSGLESSAHIRSLCELLHYRLLDKLDDLSNCIVEAAQAAYIAFCGSGWRAAVGRLHCVIYCSHTGRALNIRIYFREKLQQRGDTAAPCSALECSATRRPSSAMASTGRAAAKKTSVEKIATVVAAYFVVSISLVFVNKWLMSGDGTTIPAPLFVTWFQCVVTVGICWGLGRAGRTAERGTFLHQFPEVQFE